MNMKLIATALLAISTVLPVTTTFAAEPNNANQAKFQALKAEYEKGLEAAAKSSDVRGGLVKACAIKYKPAIESKTLTQADVNKLCDCSVIAEGQTTAAQNWELQSAVNAKNKAKFEQLQVGIMKRQADVIKKCVGTSLDQKLTKITQQTAAK